MSGKSIRRQIVTTVFFLLAAVVLAGRPIPAEAVESGVGAAKGSQAMEKVLPKPGARIEAQPAKPAKQVAPDRPGTMPRLVRPDPTPSAFAPSLVNREERILLELGRPPSKVEILVPGRPAVTLAGKGARSFDLTERILGARGTSLTLRIHDDDGGIEQVVLDTAKHKAIALSRRKAPAPTVDPGDIPVAEARPTLRPPKGSLLPGVDGATPGTAGDLAGKKTTRLISPTERMSIPDPKSPMRQSLAGDPLPIPKPRLSDDATDPEPAPGTSRFGAARLESRVSGAPRLGDSRMSKERPGAVAQQPVGEVAPKWLDRGIEIISPGSGDVYSPSSLIPIRYRFSRTVAPGGVVVFAVAGGGAEVASLHVRNDNPPGPADPHRQIDLQLPGDVSGGAYLITAEHEDSGAIGLSDLFRVISLEAEGVGGAEGTIGDAGGFGGSGTETIGEGDGTTAYHDLALGDVWVEPSLHRLTALVRNNGDAFAAEVEFDVDVAILGSVRTIERHLVMAAGERMEVVLHQFDPAVVSRYRHECGLPLSVVVRVPEWQRGIPDARPSNDQIAKTLYLPGGGIRIANRYLVVGRDGFGGGGTVVDNGMLDWARDFAIERRDESSTSDLETSLTIKNCDARRFYDEELMVHATARGTWSCGDGSLNRCHHEESVFGPAPFSPRLSPGEQWGFDLYLRDLRRTDLLIRIEVSMMRYGFGDDFRFILGWRD